VQGKPGITKGGQVCLIVDVDRICPRAYLHRHNCHEEKFKNKGPNEVYHLWNQLAKLLMEEEASENVNPLNKKRDIF
jgi:hypothetical protein